MKVSYIYAFCFIVTFFPSPSFPCSRHHVLNSNRHPSIPFLLLFVFPPFFLFLHARCSPAGWFCSSTALSTPSGRCHAGFYCRSGSDTPTQHLCTLGSYCPVGSALPAPCLPGFYCASEGLARPTGTFGHFVYVSVTYDVGRLMAVH